MTNFILKRIGFIHRGQLASDLGTKAKITLALLNSLSKTRYVAQRADHAITYTRAELAKLLAGTAGSRGIYDQIKTLKDLGYVAEIDPGLVLTGKGAGGSYLMLYTVAMLELPEDVTAEDRAFMHEMKKPSMVLLFSEILEKARMRFRYEGTYCVTGKLMECIRAELGFSTRTIRDCLLKMQAFGMISVSGAEDAEDLDLKGCGADQKILLKGCLLAAAARRENFNCTDQVSSSKGATKEERNEIRNEISKLDSELIKIAEERARQAIEQEHEAMIRRHDAQFADLKRRILMLEKPVRNGTLHFNAEPPKQDPGAGPVAAPMAQASGAQPLEKNWTAVGKNLQFAAAGLEKNWTHARVGEEAWMKSSQYGINIQSPQAAQDWRME